MGDHWHNMPPMPTEDYRHENHLQERKLCWCTRSILRPLHRDPLWGGLQGGTTQSNMGLPPCRGFCNCSICRNRKGKGATGILIQLAQAKGYDNVAAYLKALQSKKGTDEFDEEEEEELDEGDGEGEEEKPKKK